MCHKYFTITQRVTQDTKQSDTTEEKYFELNNVNFWSIFTKLEFIKFKKQVVIQLAYLFNEDKSRCRALLTFLNESSPSYAYLLEK